MKRELTTSPTTAIRTAVEGVDMAEEAVAVSLGEGNLRLGARFNAPSICFLMLCFRLCRARAS